MWTIPNILTILRICTFPVFIYLIFIDRYVAAMILIVAAGLTDAFDGVIARALNQQSEVGRILDPMADKLLAVSSYATFSLKGLLPPWLGALVIGRDVVLSVGALILVILGMKVNISPSILGKRTTGVQIGMLVLALLGALPHTGPIVHTPGVLSIAAVLTGTMTVASGFHYNYIAFKDYEKGALLRGARPSVGNGA